MTFIIATREYCFWRQVGSYKVISMKKVTPLRLSMMANSKIPIFLSQIGIICIAFSCQKLALTSRIRFLFSIISLTPSVCV